MFGQPRKRSLTGAPNLSTHAGQLSPSVRWTSTSRPALPMACGGGGDGQLVGAVDEDHECAARAPGVTPLDDRVASCAATPFAFRTRSERCASDRHACANPHGHAAPSDDSQDDQDDADDNDGDPRPARVVLQAPLAFLEGSQTYPADGVKWSAVPLSRDWVVLSGRPSSAATSGSGRSRVGALGCSSTRRGRRLRAVRQPTYAGRGAAFAATVSMSAGTLATCTRLSE